MTVSFQCATCKHYWGVGTCAAFSDQIPSEILRGEVDHADAYVGDHGLRFEQGPQDYLKDVFGAEREEPR